jgi:uncharacterized protein YbbC (DUF1343 family)
VQIHVLARRGFQPVRTGVAVIQVFHDLYPQEFRWQQPPYEYEYDRLPFDVIAGTTTLRTQLEARTELAAIVAGWGAGEAAFAQQRQPYLLY